MSQLFIVWNKNLHFLYRVTHSGPFKHIEIDCSKIELQFFAGNTIVSCYTNEMRMFAKKKLKDLTKL